MFDSLQLHQQRVRVVDFEENAPSRPRSYHFMAGCGVDPGDTQGNFKYSLISGFKVDSVEMVGDVVKEG